MLAFPRRVTDQALTALIPAERGLAVATVSSDGGAKPALKHCNYIPCVDADCDAEFIRKQCKSLRIGNRPCTTTMNLGEYTLLSVEAPDVPPAELRAAVRWQIKDLIDFHIDDAVLDVFDSPASGADRRQHNLYVVVARQSSVKQYINPLQAAEVNLTTIDIPELVIRNICAQCPEDKNGLVFIYLGRQQGVVTITKNATLYLARGLEFGYEQLLSGAGLSGELGGGDDFNPEFDRLVLEVQRSLDYYDRYFSHSAVAKILINPTEAPLPGLPAYMHRSTGITSAVLDLNEIVNAHQPLDAQQQARCLLAVGAALRQEKKTL